MAAACAVPAAPLVAGLIGSVDCKVHGLAEAGYAAQVAWGWPVATLLTVLMTVYVAFIGYRLARGRGGVRMGDITVSVLKLGLIMALAPHWALIETQVYDALFQAPAAIGGRLLGQVGGGHADPFAGLQTAFDALQASAASFASRAGARDSAMQGGPAFAAFALNGGGMVMLLSTLGVVLACKVVLAVLLALTPLIAGLVLFETTKGLVEGWLKAMIALAVLPMVATLALALELSMLEPSLKALAAMREAQRFAPLDTGPAVTVLGLTLVFAAALMLAAIAVTVTVTAAAAAAGLRLPRATAEASRNITAQIEPRDNAAPVAAAALAPERRDNARAATISLAGARRLALASYLGPSLEPSPAVGSTPLGR